LVRKDVGGIAMLSLKDTVKKDFGFLFNERGFFLVNDSSEDMPPSYAIVIVQSGNIRLRFIKDRVDFFVDVGVAEKPEEWCDIYEVLDKLKINGYINEEVKPIHRPDAIRRVLEKYIVLINEFPKVI